MKLINQQQPFGMVQSHITQRGDSGPAGTRNAISQTTEVPNHGTTKVESFADKGAGAYAMACKNRDNPFAWTGHPK
jgi:hypothetical protein